MRTAVPSGHTSQVATAGRAREHADVAQRRHAPASPAGVRHATPADARGHRAELTSANSTLPSPLLPRRRAVQVRRT